VAAPRSSEATATLALKVVPGASRTRLVGRLGDRWKVAVAAPPEGGAANEEACACLAHVLRVRPSDVSVVRGTSSPLKTIAVRGLSSADADATLAAACEGTAR
jgi:uncharacterized protein (TIGR00251 family)